MNQMQVFQNREFGQVRTISIDGQPWFVGKDVADALQYDQTSNMVKRLDEEDFMSSKLDGMNMKSILINESGLYAAILGSQLPSAKKFKRWVTSEVLPTIRKNGAYAVQGYQPKATSVGEVVNLINMTRKSMKEQGCDPREIAIAVKQICDQFGIHLPDCFIKPNEITMQDAMDMVAFVYSKSKQENKNINYEDFIIVQTTVKKLKG